MAELDSFDAKRLALFGRVVDALYDRLVKKVIAETRAKGHSCRLCGEDFTFEDAWEEFKYQVQREDSFCFDRYAEYIRGVCDLMIDKFDREQRQLLWLSSDGYGDSWAEKDEVSIDDFEDESIAKELYDRVLDVANEEELAVDPDFEPDEDDPDESDTADGDSTSRPTPL